MKRKGLDRLILLLGIIIAVLLMLMGVLLLSMQNGTSPAPVVTPVPVPEVTPDDSLITAEDLKPDVTLFGTAQDGTLTNGHGEVIQLSQYAGKPLVLLFWSSWCGDCKTYMTGAYTGAKAAAEIAGAQLLLVCREGVRGDTYEAASRTLREYGLPDDTLMDPGATLFHQLGLHSVPTLAFFDASGTYRWATTDSLNAEQMTGALEDLTGKAEARTAAFMRALTGDDGMIPSTWVAGQDGPKGGATVLSETVGLMMLYAADTGDRESFDLYHSAASAMTVTGLVSWQSAGGILGNVNASLDDLRVLEALCAADRLWGGFADEIIYRSDAFYTRCVRDGLMRDWASLSDGRVSSDVTLCYLDLTAMRAVAAYDARWADAADRAEALLLHSDALISDAFPLWKPVWNAESRGFTGASLQMSESMVTVLNCARAGIVAEKTLDLLENMLRTGPVYARYDTQGQVVSGFDYESTATYALLAQIGLVTGRSEITRLALARMDRTRRLDGTLAGAYCYPASVNYTFDTAEALLALHLAGR